MKNEVKLENTGKINLYLWVYWALEHSRRCSRKLGGLHDTSPTILAFLVLTAAKIAQPMPVLLKSQFLTDNCRRKQNKTPRSLLFSITTAKTKPSRLLKGDRTGREGGGWTHLFPVHPRLDWVSKYHQFCSVQNGEGPKTSNNLSSYTAVKALRISR